MSSSRRHAAQRGFTLVELMIVVIIVAILAAAIIPQFSSSTEEAKLSTLKADLAQLRNAVELYYHQHNNRYPGSYSSADGTTAETTIVGSRVSFLAQLTQYSDGNGQTSGIKSATFKYGPYLKTSMPANPFHPGAEAVTKDLLVDNVVNDITVTPTADGATGWKFYLTTGRFVANDNITLSDGTTQTVLQ